MSSKRISVLFSILKGLLAAVAVTLTGMLLIALLTVFLRISDGLLGTLNQLLKALAVITGVAVSVGRGGSRGFLTGAAVGLAYMIAGYALYVFLGGPYSASAMLGEILLGAAIGAVTGSIMANLRPGRRRGRK